VEGEIREGGLVAQGGEGGGGKKAGERAGGMGRGEVRGREGERLVSVTLFTGCLLVELGISEFLLI